MWSGVELDWHVDRPGDVGEVAGVAGDGRGLVADGGRDDDGVDDIGGTGGGTGYPGGPAGALVVGAMSQALRTREIWC